MGDFLDSDTAKWRADFALWGSLYHRHAAGSHEIWHNSSTKRFTTIPNHSGDLPEGTLRAILKQAGVAPEEFLTHR